MPRKRWIRGKTWVYDSSHSSEEAAWKRVGELRSIGNEAKKQKEGSRWKVFTRVKL